jgi:hypothetical protein
MIKAHHPKAKFFTEYIYTHDQELTGNNLDIIISRQCSGKSDEGFNCENCYTSKLYDILNDNFSNYIGLKKLLTYQMGLYEDPNNWIKEFRRWMEHSVEHFVRDTSLKYLIEEVLDDMTEEESNNADFGSFLNITNNFVNSTIHQLNQGGNNSLAINYNSILDEMEADGVPTEIIEEGKELLKDANKSDSLKTIAANWIKNLPFKVMEKAGSWAVENYSQLQQYQNDLMNWINSLPN